MKRKIEIILTVCVLGTFLVGWGNKKIELLDNNKLINLDKAIEYAKPGGAWSKNTEDQLEENISVNNEYKEDIIAGDTNVKYIYVKDEQVIYDGTNISEEKLSEVIECDYREQITFVLVDDWAEASLYRRIRQKLDNLHESIGLSFTEEQ